MKSKNISCQVKRRINAFLVIILILLASFVTTISVRSYKIHSLKNEQKQLEERLLKLQEEAEDLSNEIIKLKDPEYIAKYARENYYYTKSGEYVIKIDKIEDENQIIIQANTNKAYYLISAVLLVLIVLVAILKKKSQKKIMEY